MDRRTFLSAATAAAAAPLILASARSEAATTPTPLEKIAAALAQSRMPVAFDGQRFSGQGYDWLLKRGSEAHAFLLGEEHGIAENPKLAAQLFAALTSHGYRYAAIEISPPMAAAVDRTIVGGGPDALRTLLTTPESRVAFAGLREEADWLVAARKAVRGNDQMLWGLDYELAADRYLIKQLKERSKPDAAAAALAKLEAASSASWTRYAETHNPQFIYSFAGDPKTVLAVRAAWPAADVESRQILDTLERTLAINAEWVAGNGYQSNVLRTQFIRENFFRYWRHTRQDERVMIKLGASHVVRGLSMSDVFDLGTLVPELVAERGGKSFHLLVLPGPGTQTANLDPTQFRYVPGNRNEYGEGTDLFDKAILPGTFTLFDTAPLRPITSSSEKGIPLPLWRVIQGFDAVLVMTGSHPSTNL